METAFQFLVINNKASKVSMDHIRALALHFEEAALEARLETAELNLDPNVGFVGLVNNEEDSPFREWFPTPLTPEADRVIVPAAIEASLGYIQQKKVRAFESEDVLLEFFYTIWRRIRERWAALWQPDSRLLSKVGIICVTYYMADTLVGSYDLGRLDVADPEEVAQLVDELLSHQERRFWQVAWTSASYDTKAGRALIVASTCADCQKLARWGAMARGCRTRRRNKCRVEHVSVFLAGCAFRFSQTGPWSRSGH